MPPRATDDAVTRLANRLSDERRFVLASHVDPDGDAIGSLCGLARALAADGREVYAALSNDRPGPITYRDVPGFDLLAPASQAPAWPVLLALDVPVTARLGDLQPLVDRAELLVRIDHHPMVDPAHELDIIDEEAPATSYLCWRLIQAMGLPMDVGTVEALYVGLVTDTGRFQYSNATPAAFEMAAQMVAGGVRPEKVFRYVYDRRRLPALKLTALVIERATVSMNGRLAWAAIDEGDLQRLGALPEETENLIDELRAIEGIQVALMLKAGSDGIRGSLRSKGAVDVSVVARALGGGGHREASGFPFEGTVSDAVAAVEQLVSRQLGAP